MPRTADFRVLAGVFAGDALPIVVQAGSTTAPLRVGFAGADGDRLAGTMSNLLFRRAPGTRARAAVGGVLTWLIGKPIADARGSRTGAMRCDSVTHAVSHSIALFAL